MKISHLLIVAGIIVFIGWKILYHPMFPQRANDFLAIYSADNSRNLVATIDPCVHRTQCAYIYLAPWCPHCQGMIQHIANIRNLWITNDRPGLRVIIGNDKIEAINAMAARVGEPVFLDIHNKFSHEAHVRYFPYFIIVDDQQRIIASGQDGGHWMENEINSHRR